MNIIEIKCTSCGAPMRVTADEVKRNGEVAAVREGQVLRCDYCGTEHAAGYKTNVVRVHRQTAFDQRGQTVGRQVNVTGLKIDRLK
jgi:uncharacterized Zn finger protein